MGDILEIPYARTRMFGGVAPVVRRSPANGERIFAGGPRSRHAGPATG
jgi:hypothetical protein